MGQLRERWMPRVSGLMICATGGFWETCPLSHSELEKSKVFSFHSDQWRWHWIRLGDVQIGQLMRVTGRHSLLNFQIFPPNFSFDIMCYRVLMLGESPFLTKPFGAVSIWGSLTGHFQLSEASRFIPMTYKCGDFLTNFFFWGERASCFITKACVGLLDWSDSPASSPKELRLQAGTIKPMKAGVGIGLRVLVIIGKCSTTELQHRPLLSGLDYPELERWLSR